MGDNRTALIVAGIGAFSTLLASIISAHFSYDNGFAQGVKQTVSITDTAPDSPNLASSVDEEVIYNNGYDEGYKEGFEKGKYGAESSFNETAIRKEGYDRGYQDGFEKGKTEGGISTVSEKPSESESSSIIDETRIFPWDLDYHTVDHGDGLQVIDELDDNFGNIHKNVTVCNGYAIKDFWINGEYSNLSGTIFRSYEGRGQSNPYQAPKITVVCDGKEVYQKSIYLGEEPDTFNINLKNVKVLQINVIHIGKSDNYRYYRGGISDFVISK